MKIAIVGVGAVGGYFGGRMIEHGLDVTLLARTETARILKRDGLHISSILGDFSVDHPNIADDTGTLEPMDVVFLAVKAYQVAAAAKFASAVVGPDTTVIPLQNGVDAPKAAASILGEEVVIGGLSRIFSERVKTGRIRHSDIRPSIAFGELRGGISERVASIAEHLAPVSTMDAQASEDIVTDMWKKLLMVATLGAAGAVSRAPVGVLRSLDPIRATLLSVAAEIGAVARSQGADVAPEFSANCLNVLEKLTPETTASMHRDIVHGLPSELEEQVGAVIRYGIAAGVGTPVLSTIYGALLPGELRARGKVEFDDLPAADG